ncbi:hypothetical protein [Piscinibacter sp. XHJ-5]|uniref:hypothetical protein n=1 Tax=Piscinibacter sp. XHJ-5 TaxID=3037797 RepID=UPI0024536BF7|nr:hypothetical protein [Piscinibacter sp. XHJ-5]
MDRKFVVALAWVFVAAGPAVSQAPDPAGASHPLVGKWQWTNSVNRCTEVYDFRPDGTAAVTSGAERSDNTYTVSREPDARGFYALTMKITKDHGGKDCGDIEQDETGQEHTNYLLFEPSREMHVVCQEPNLKACFGPLKRMGK